MLLAHRNFLPEDQRPNSTLQFRDLKTIHFNLIPKFVEVVILCHLFYYGVFPYNSKYNY